MKRLYLTVIFVVLVLAVAGCTSFMPNQNPNGNSNGNGNANGDNNNNNNDDGNFNEPPESGGCCTPFCSEMTETECVQSGGAWAGGACSSVDECKTSCCSPFCVDMSDKQCSQAGGSPSGVSCSQDENCQVSCCTPFCTEMPKQQCTEAGGAATGASCDAVDACKKSCCSPTCIEMTSEMCTEAGGTPSGTSCDNTKECKKSCCTPICFELTDTECAQHGGEPTGTSCENTKDCKKGCCPPFCAETTNVMCDQLGGQWTAAACSEVDECKKGCCMPFCAELTKAECGSEYGYGGIWNPGTCDDYPECDKICCMPFRQASTKKVCKDLGGTEAPIGECSDKNTIKIETLVKHTCGCDTDSFKIACTVDNDIRQTFSATYVFDHVEDNTWAGGDIIYYFTGKGIATSSGSSKDTETQESFLSCPYANPPVDVPFTKTTTRTDTFTESRSSNDLELTIVKKGDEYYFDFTYLAISTDIHSAYQVLSNAPPCPGQSNAISKSETSSDIIKDGIETFLPSAFTAKSLTGEQPIEGYQPENTFHCITEPNGTGTVIWNFELPK